MQCSVGCRICRQYENDIEVFFLELNCKKRVGVKLGSLWSNCPPALNSNSNSFIGDFGWNALLCYSGRLQSVWYGLEGFYGP